MKTVNSAIGLLFSVLLSLPSASLLSFGSRAFADPVAQGPLENLEIKGKVQLWKRLCDAPSKCSLPIAISTIRHVTGEVAAPTPVTATSTTIETKIPEDETSGLGAWSITVQVFRKTKAGETDSSYTAYQVTLRQQASGKTVFLCSSYEPEQSAGLYFPVGACGGELPGSEGKSMVGVTFFR